MAKKAKKELSVKRVKKDLFDEEKYLEIIKSVPRADLSKLFKEGVVIQWKFGWWQAKAKVKDDDLLAGLPTEVLRVTQDLLDDRTLLSAMGKCRRLAVDYLVAHSYPFPVSAMVFIPKSNILKVHERMKELQKEYYGYLDQLVEDYDRLIEQFRKKYPRLSRENKYPSKERIRSKFYFEWAFRIFDVPDGKLGILPPEVYKEEASKIKSEVDEVKKMTVDLITNKLIERVDTLRNQCVNGRFNKATIESINEIITTFDETWGAVVDEETLQIAIAKVKSVMAVTDAEKLRDSESFAKAVEKKMGEAFEVLQNVPDVEIKYQRKVEL